MRPFGVLHISVIFLSIYLSSAQRPGPGTGYQPGNEVDDYEQHQVPDGGDTIEIPKSVEVVIKRLDEGVTYVEHVYKPSYHNESLRDYSKLDCGITDFDVVVHYCDCRDICDVYRKSNVLQTTSARFFLSYDLHLHVYDNKIYFSTAVTDERMDDDDELANVPKNFLKPDNSHTFYGPFAMPDRAAESARTTNSSHHFGKLLGDKVLRELVLYKNTDDVYKPYIWTHQNKDTSENGRDNMEVEVSLFPGYIETFNRLECVDLDDTYNFVASNLTVKKGGCVRLYRGRRCTGTDAMVFQEHVDLYFSVGTVDKSTFPGTFQGIKSMSSCCRGFPEPGRRRYLFKSAGDQRTGDSAGERVECSCSCSTTPPSAKKKTPTANRPDRWVPDDLYRTAKVQPPTLSDLIRINTTAVYEAQLSIRYAVVAAIDDSPMDRISAAAGIAHMMHTLSDMAFRVLTLIETSPNPVIRGLYVRRFVEDVAFSSAEAAKRLWKATPETASGLAFDAALEGLCTQAFVTDAIQLIISNTQELSEEFALKTRSEAIRTERTPGS